jgi:hypothetical protein
MREPKICNFNFKIICLRGELNRESTGTYEYLESAFTGLLYFYFKKYTQCTLLSWFNLLWAQSNWQKCPEIFFAYILSWLGQNILTFLNKLMGLKFYTFSEISGTWYYFFDRGPRANIIIHIFFSRNLRDSIVSRRING